MQKLIIFIYLVLTAAQKSSAFFISTPSNFSDTVTPFKKEIPTFNGSFDLFYKLKKQKEDQLKLDSLESGFDSLQIRIWYDYALFQSKDLIIIKRTKGKWTAEYFEMIVNWDPGKKTETIISNKIKPIMPESGWDSFITKLLNLDVMTLINMEDIPGLQDSWDDGVTYNVEVAEKRLYRFYSYHLPEKFEDKYWQAKKMVQILNLISNEFIR